MPWESRIKNEWTRRIALAGLMLLVLGGSTGLAAWMSAARRPMHPIGGSSHQFGVFRIALGSEWQIQRRDEQSAEPQWAELVERGQTGRLVQVIELEDLSPRTPLEAMQQAMSQLTPSASWFTSEAVQRDGHTQLVYAGQSIGAGPRGQVPLKHVLAVVTADGRRYLAIHLRGSGRIGRQDVDRLWEIASSVNDSRFEAVSTVPVQIGPVGLQLPRGLVASIQNDAPTSGLLISPQRTGRFYRITVRYYDLASLKSQFNPVPEHEASTSVLLKALLMATYEQMHGAAPDEQHMATLKAEDRDVHIVILHSGPASVTHREIWAVDLGERGGLMIELISESPVAKLVRYAAQLLLTGLSIEPAGEGQP